MDQYYIVRSIVQMFTTIFRLGPLVLLQFVLAVATVVVWLFMNLPSCTYYTLAYLTLIFFLIQMIVSMRMMKGNPSLRKNYLYRRVTESYAKYCVRSIWDNLNIILVIMLLYYSLIVDGITLYQSSQNSQVSTSYGQQTCEYTLFSLCLFSELQKTLSNADDQDIMVMWLLYAANGFITTIICVTFSKQYYNYCSSMVSNRKLKKELGCLNQTLLDCHVYSIKSQMIVNQSLRNSVGECSICLNEIIQQKIYMQQKVIRLRCGHIFHKECLDSWLQVKDHCPFRCFTS